MVFPEIDLAAAVFFVLALVTLARYRPAMRTVDVESYNYTAGGLSVLALAAVFHVLAHAGLLSGVTFLSEPLLVRLIVWIGFLTGAVLLASGVAAWLPLWRKFAQLRGLRITRLELIKKLEQLRAVTDRPTGILVTALEYMIEHCELAGGAVYRCDETGQAVLLASRGPSVPPAFPLRGMRFETQGARSHPATDLVLPPGVDQPSLVVPVSCAGSTEAFYLLWAPGVAALDDETRVVLKLAAGIVAARMRVSNVFVPVGGGDLPAKIETAARLLRVDRDLKENIAALAAPLSELLHANLITLVVDTEDSPRRRITVSTEGAVLDERALDPRSESDHLDRVIATGRALRIGDLRESPELRGDQLLLSSDARSLVAVPLGLGPDTVGALSVTAIAAHVFRPIHVQALQLLGLRLAALVSDNARRQSARREVLRLTALEGLLRRIGQGAALTDIFRHAAAMLKRLRAVSVVRIATYDPDGAFLRSWALTHDADLEPVTPSHGHLILSLMPHHRRLAETGRTICLKPESPAPMTPAEARQVLVADPGHVLLVPVKRGDRTMGAISLALTETGPQVVAVAEAVGAVLSLALQPDWARKRTTRRLAESRAGDHDVRDPAVRGYIRSSLSGILGSLHSLQTQPQPSAEALRQHLSIINTSARRLSACLAEQDCNVD